MSENKLDRMANNDQWLFENTPRASYRAHGVRRNEGVKIAAGLARIHARKHPTATEPVYFGNFFSAMSRPVVTTGTVAGKQRRIFVTIEGLGQLHPDHRGFRVKVAIEANNKKNRKIERTFYVAWHAIGY